MTIGILNLRMLTREANVLPPQHVGRITLKVGYVVYITDCVWAAVYRNVAEDSARNRLALKAT